MPDQHSVTDLAQYLRLVSLKFPAIQGVGWKYRGQSDSTWRLIPKAGRQGFYDSEWKKMHPHAPDKDLGRFNFWRRQCAAVEGELPVNDFECLAVAQHHGLATRLLDWTTNPLVALFFAVNENPEKAGAVYACSLNSVVNIKIASLGQLHGVSWLYIRPLARRILMQDGLFTIHSPPDKPVIGEMHRGDELIELSGDPWTLNEIIIPSEFKKILLNQLNDCGINCMKLFPDLDGISRHVNWEWNSSLSLGSLL